MNRQELYRPLTLRTLVNYQVQYLARKFDFGRESRIAELLISRINTAITRAEREIGIHRVAPFELYWVEGRRRFTLPLFRPEDLTPLYEGETFIQVKERVEARGLALMKKHIPSATRNDLLRIISPWTLVRGRGPGTYAEELVKTRADTEERKAWHATIDRFQPRSPKERFATPDISAPQALIADLSHMVAREAGLGKAVARRLVEEVITLRNLVSPRRDSLKCGELPLLVTHVRAHLSEEVATKFRRLAPVIVTLWSKEEKEAMKQMPFSVPEYLEQLKARIIRVCFEAYRQNGLLTLMEMQWIFQLSSTRISELIRSFQKEQSIIVPTPGTILDAGRSMTHKDIIVRLHLEGYNVKEIAQMTYHSPRAVDNYIGTFEAVLILKLFKVPMKLMGRLLHKGVSLVKEYLNLIDEFYKDEREIKNYLIAKGVKF